MVLKTTLLLFGLYQVVKHKNKNKTKRQVVHYYKFLIYYSV